jgi:hypothetical protein
VRNVTFDSLRALKSADSQAGDGNSKTLAKPPFEFPDVMRIQPAVSRPGLDEPVSAIPVADRQLSEAAQAVLTRIEDKFGKARNILELRLRETVASDVAFQEMAPDQQADAFRFAQEDINTAHLVLASNER